MPVLAIAWFGACALRWLVRWGAGPLRGDDGLELGPQQVLVGADQVNEGLVGGRSLCTGGVQHLTHRVHPAQALMARCSSPLVAMEILRGLACSATGIARVSTPVS